MSSDRRRFLAMTAGLSVGALAPLAHDLRAEEKKPPEKKPDDKKDEEDVGAAEDLMREHGVLNRLLLIYEEGMRRVKAREDVTPDVFRKPAELARKFVEDYHEK